jgi:hypothetical protein
LSLLEAGDIRMQNLGDFRAMPDRDLLMELYRNTQHGSKIRRAISERMHYQGVSHPADLEGLRQIDWVREVTPETIPPIPETRRRILDLTKDNFPFMDTEPVLDWMRETQPYEIAIKARDEGYACQNMKDPEQAVNWMNYAIQEKSEWRNLPVGAWRFWKAFYQKAGMWKLVNNKVTAA